MGQEPKVFGISRGIAKYNLHDHYAVLGLPLTTNPNQIRKKFLKLAKALHPDVFGRTDAEKEQATQLFAKMVGPAYQALTSDRDRNEYFATLKLFAKGMRQKGETPELHSEVAKKLQKYNHETTYIKAVEEVSAKQYESLDRILPSTDALSELNLVYLLAQDAITAPAAVPIQQTANPSTSNTAATAAKPKGPSKAQRNVQLAEVYINKKQWSEATKELKAGEKLDPTNAKLHALLGVVYMNQNVASMAKASFQKALKFDPKEPTALKYINKVGTAAKTATAKQNAKKQSKKGGGLFGWGKK